MIGRMPVLLAAQDAGAPCCGFLFVVGVFMVIFVASKAVSFSATSGFEQIRQNGTPALGIVLKIDAIGTTIQGGTTTFSGMSAAGGWTILRNSIHQKNAVVDVEVPGQPPYQVATAVLMPLNMAGDVLPGSTVELRVDPKDRNKVVIVGPGSGFAGFARIPVTFQQDGSQ